MDALRAGVRAYDVPYALTYRRAQPDDRVSEMHVRNATFFYAGAEFAPAPARPAGLDRQTAIVAEVVGGVLVLAVLLFIAYWVMWRRDAYA